MTLRIPPMGGFTWAYSNNPAPSATPGTSVVPGASNAEGAWTEVASAANIAQDVYDLLLVIYDGATATVSKMHLLDIGVDPAGGTAYTERVANIQCGMSPPAGLSLGLRFYVPLFIPAGASVAVRIQGKDATAGTVRVVAQFGGRPSRPEFTPKLTRAETLGAITTSRGVVVVPGASAAEGAWTLIGTTTFPWRYILPTFQLDDNIANATIVYLDVAQGNGTIFTVLAEDLMWLNTSTAEVMQGGPGPNPQLWCNIRAPADIYVRISQDRATPDSNFSVLVTGMG